jgi:hypothetical protein
MDVDKIRTMRLKPEGLESLFVRCLKATGIDKIKFGYLEATG